MANDITGDKSATERTPEEDDSLLASKETVSALVQKFEDAEEATWESRQLAERDRDYVDNKQYTKEELEKLKKRGQPDTINNEIRRKIDFLTGFEATVARSDPKAFPRNPGEDEEAAEATTDMLRFQEHASELDQHFSDVWENMIVEGFGGVEVLGPLKKNPKVIEVLLWKWDRLFYDPHSSEHDFSDATYIGGVMWKDVEDAKRRWPKAANWLEVTVSEEAPESETYEDKPRVFWARHGRRPRVRIVQIYYKEGDQWHWCLFCKCGKIDGGPVEFIDENEDSDCPLILQSAYVDRENNRYGMVRELIGPQDEVNKRSSKALHMLTVDGGYYESGAIDDVDEFKAEAAKADGWAEVNSLDGIRPKDRTGDISGNLALMQESKQAIKSKGPNAALAGKQEAGASGRAIRASQEGGIIETARLRDRHKHWKKRVYRSIWNRCRQFLDQEVWIRITDDENKVKFVGFNRPMTVGETLEEQIRQTPQGQDMAPEQITEQVAQAAQNIGMDPEQQTEQLKNVPARMDVDIDIENATESVNIQEEQFEKLVELAPVIPFPPIVYLKASSFRNKDELIETMEGSEQDAQARQQETELKFRELFAKIAGLEAKADKDRATAIDTAVEANLKVVESAGAITNEQVAGMMAGPEPNIDPATFGQQEPAPVQDPDQGAVPQQELPPELLEQTQGAPLPPEGAGLAVIEPDSPFGPGQDPV